LEPRTQTRLFAIYKQGVRDDLNAAEKKGPHDQHLFVLSTGVQRNLRHITIRRGTVLTQPSRFRDSLSAEYPRLSRQIAIRRD
jgi:hypothetical protein